jgi:hypothetical protein
MNSVEECPHFELYSDTTMGENASADLIARAC